MHMYMAADDLGRLDAGKHVYAKTCLDMCVHMGTGMCIGMFIQGERAADQRLALVDRVQQLFRQVQHAT